MAAEDRVSGAVQKALETRFFGRFTSREQLLSVTTTARVILLNNPERIGFVLVNTGTDNITFATQQDVTLSKGFVLPNAGDTVSVSFLEDGQFSTREFSAIAGGAGGELFVTEFVRYNL